jgi:hypothetical protein
MKQKNLDEQAILAYYREQYAIKKAEWLRLESELSSILKIMSGVEERMNLQKAPHDRPTAVKIEKNAFVGMKLREAIVAYLRLVRQPQTTREIADALQEGGLETRITNTVLLANAARTTMERADSVFTQIGRRWELKEWNESEEDKQIMDKVRKIFG